MDLSFRLPRCQCLTWTDASYTDSHIHHLESCRHEEKLKIKKYLQFEVKLTFSSSTAPSLLFVIQHSPCQSNCQPLTVSPPRFIMVPI